MSAVGRQSGSAARKRYWFVWEVTGGEHVVQLLDAAYKPIDKPLPVARTEFFKRFRMETSIFVASPDSLDLSVLDAAAGRDDIFAEEAEPEQAARAAPETGQRMREAARLDQTLRDDFSIALTKLRRGDRASAVNLLDKLANRREGIIPAHKHTFTSFAVKLRKQQMPAVAFKFYQRALELSPEDSYAYFNMARIMFELGDYDGTEKHLQQALYLDFDFVEAHRFLDYLARQRNGVRPHVSAGAPDRASSGAAMK
jgi:tetratricopeptide (TPR) repeat protein